jgi:phage tail protein X
LQKHQNEKNLIKEMESRYLNNKIKKTIDGRQVYRSKIYPNIPPSDQDTFVATETGDRLDTLAYQFYGDSRYWWIIATSNNIHDANIGFEEGTILRIPANYIEIAGVFTQS